MSRCPTRRLQRRRVQRYQRRGGYFGRAAWMSQAAAGIAAAFLERLQAEPGVNCRFGSCVSVFERHIGMGPR